MSSCQGELTEKEFNVHAVDENEKVLFDGTATTMRNGFFELWLPRNRNVIVTIERSGLTASDVIKTLSDSKTCITTFRLQ